MTHYGLFFLLLRLNNPLLSHESRLQPKVNPSPVSGKDLNPHTTGIKIIIVAIISILVKRKLKVQYSSVIVLNS